MALILADRVKETSTTAGNGTFTLAGAASGYQSFAVVGNGNTTSTVLQDKVLMNGKLALEPIRLLVLH
jgi:hypothetical protein